MTPQTAVHDTTAVRDAEDQALAVARSSGVEIREIETTGELTAVSGLLSGIWHRDAATPQLTVEMLKALAKTGNYVSAAAYEGRLVGAAVAFFAAPERRRLHSHIAGVVDGHQARNVGHALKLHQRAWALRRGIPTITWTFDPLVRRNAYFNIAKLGARVMEYLPDFYGEMHDAVNAGDPSDRLLVAWDLLAGNTGPPVREAGTALAVGPDGGPRRDGWPAGAPAIVAVPPDVERLRAERPRLAAEWRLAVRDVLGSALADGARIAEFRRDQGYVVVTGRGAARR
ncbi:GNAT family N-acetyltransferase [Actinomadura sp. DC4]|uniref:GNAT family N-acetyltransferase n=1 Tax=Actinomadura sp. DC4 TaxID=3055069 RepID=UPI0025B219D2|nr:GNAT family N-acetyltransferase [Actinomadura sp. DC4]MDN3353635.1 GNAT family N-acetyltransferase [Actinomadura sp. DC4]